MAITAPETTQAPAGVSGRAVLARAKAALVARKQADVDLIRAAAEWAHARPATGLDGVAGWGDGEVYGEGFVALAGEGAPLVAEFAPYELAAALGWTTEAARSLMSDALELLHRLPGLWAEVAALRVSAATARHAAEQAHDLAPDAAAHADRLLVRAARRGLLTSRRVRVAVDEARLYHDPDRAVADEQHALASRRVKLVPGNTPATLEVAMVLDTADALDFDHAVTAVAAALGRLGDQDSLEVRRARAVGILAHPHTAADLLDGGTEVAARPAPAATLYLHLDHSTLTGPDPGQDTFPVGVRGEGTGLLGHHGDSVLSSDLLTRWLKDSTVVVKPVIDLTHPDTLRPVDRHDPPPAMAEYVRLRDPVCVFPACSRPSRSCDLDHINPYRERDDGGPPGQTHPDNLAPLCRGHHRAKTHTPWDYTRNPDHTYTWTSPTGLTY